MSTKQYYSMLLICLLACAGIALADKEKEKNPENTEKTSPIPVSEPLSLKLPLVGEKGLPLIRITVGAPRGKYSKLKLSLYAPANRVLTESQPVLYWEVSEAVKTPIRFLLVNDDFDDPLVDSVIAHSVLAGKHSINIRDHGLSLLPGKVYEWSICISSAESCHLSKDMIATVRVTINRVAH